MGDVPIHHKLRSHQLGGLLKNSCYMTLGRTLPGVLIPFDHRPLTSSVLCQVIPISLYPQHTSLDENVSGV